MLLWRRVALPVLLGGLGLAWAAVHALVHDLVARPAAMHHGHGGSVEAYAAYLPTSLALCVALATALAAGLALGRRWSGLSGPAIWFFGFVPVLGLAADTLIGLPAHGPLSGAAAAELVPVVLLGLLVQIPLALSAAGLGGAILLLAERLAWAIRSSAPPIGCADGSAGPRPRRADRLPGLLLPGSAHSRAPPVPAAA
ncbi:MAG TPA: hypothetical protein VD769_14625 [Gaiellaceae bacterium]|nr:hypothetical protein [Gaiellaceae bacterium]